MNNYFCTNTGRDCPCPQPQGCVQSCQSQPEQPTHSCCCPCAEDFRKALELICCPALQGLVDSASFAFITDYYVLGTAISTAPDGTAPSDNLNAPVASFVCGGDNCESLTVSGLLYPPEVGGTALPTVVTQVALCKLRAIVFGSSDAGDGIVSNFQTISQTLGQLLRPKKPQECTSLAEALTSAAAVRASTVTVGPLVVQNSTILGRIGNVLVMSNATNNRFYLICADKVDFMG